MIEYRLAPSDMLLWVIAVYSIDARAVNLGNDVRLQGVYTSTAFTWGSNIGLRSIQRGTILWTRKWYGAPDPTPPHRAADPIKYHSYRQGQRKGRNLSNYMFSM